MLTGARAVYQHKGVTILCEPLMDSRNRINVLVVSMDGRVHQVFATELKDIRREDI